MKTSSAKHPLSQLFQFGVASLALSLALPATAQHEVDASEADYAPIRISGNENAFGYSDMAKMAMMQKMAGANRYARTESAELLSAIATREGVDEDHVIMTAGSGPVLVMTALAYAEPGKNVVSVEPGYTQLTRKFEEMGGEVKLVPLNDKLEYDLDAVFAAIDEDTAIVYICNPNNPTGTVVDPIKLVQFVQKVPEDVLVFVDEAYLELAPGGLAKHSMRPLLQTEKNMIIARTFSKVYGMAGLRIGYGVGNPEILKKLSVYHMGGPSILSCVAATAALADEEAFKAGVENYTGVRKMVTDGFEEMGLKYATPNGSFVFVHTGIEITKLQEAMEARNIMIGRPFPPMLDWARISIGTEEEMQIFLRVFEEVLTEMESPALASM